MSAPSPLWTCSCGAVNLRSTGACEACGLMRAGAPEGPTTPPRVHRHSSPAKDCEVRNCTHPECRAFAKACMAQVRALSNGMTFGSWRGKDRPPGLLERMGVPGHGLAAEAPEDPAPRIDKAAAMIQAMTSGAPSQ